MITKEYIFHVMEVMFAISILWLGSLWIVYNHDTEINQVKSEHDLKPGHDRISEQSALDYTPLFISYTNETSFGNDDILVLKYHNFGDDDKYQNFILKK
ncbi:MAG: hypothetical protein ACFCU6_10355 [Balneolaceae bacterium]